MVGGLEVENSVVGVAAEGYGAALPEREVTPHEVLHGHPVAAVVNGVVAEDVEDAFIVVVYAQCAAAVEVDVVARCLVHDDMQASLRGGVDHEVKAYVGPVVACIEAFAVTGGESVGGGAGAREGGLVAAPGYEVLRAQCLWRRGVIS